MFVDLNVSLVEDKALLGRTLAMLAKLGYDAAAFSKTITGKVTNEHINKRPKGELVLLAHVDKEWQAEAKKLRQYSRLTVILEDQSQIYSLNPSNSVLRTYDIVAAMPETEKLFQHCCQTADIDVISFDMAKRLPYFLKRPPVGQALERGIFFEICYSAALQDSTARRYLISNAQHIIRATQGRNIIISSQAAKALDLRGPYDIINLAVLFGLQQAEGKKTLTTNPRAVLLHAGTRTGTHRAVVAVAPLSSLPASDRWKVPEAAADQSESDNDEPVAMET
eukprot:comp20763_c0_seq1/m.27231 comp20763_c0_seq1/g.27231  ORF comp20763_c0_seq1/g.27231 comp20763_c0_seq1/m.27231 type:complete len:280 (-) comp20763_c0_seq1:272-1111(-)